MVLQSFPAEPQRQAVLQYLDIYPTVSECPALLIPHLTPSHGTLWMTIGEYI